ncbi:hypothetical protein [Streptomyces sp. NPDC059176]|uniref:hypothetical protein n=1 Tax=Streptomyces sp. NPDC059176 TaxID=3346758 RepID=UPI0036CEB8BF
MTSILPRLRGTGGHRADDKIAELRGDVLRLLNWQTAAQDYFAVLQQDRADVYAAWQYAEDKAARAEDIVVWQDARIRDLQRQVDELTRRLEVQCLAESAATRTQEIDLRELQARFTSGPVVSLHHSSQATSPAHVPSRAKPDPAEGAA